jgi:hypothetical protein
MVGYSEYVLEPLREGPDFTLYRGHARGEPMPLLAVAVAAELPSPQSLRRLQHEYALSTQKLHQWWCSSRGLDQRRWGVLARSPRG